jgi:hypothetical protein
MYVLKKTLFRSSLSHEFATESYRITIYDRDTEFIYVTEISKVAEFVNI